MDVTYLRNSPPGGVWWSLSPDAQTASGADVEPAAPNVAVEWFDRTGLDVRITTSDINFDLESTPLGQRVTIACPDTPVGGELGAPALPVVRRIFAAPDGLPVDWTFTESDPYEIDLAGLGFTQPVTPMQQASAIDAETVRTVYADDEDVESLVKTMVPPFQYNADAYGVDAAFPAERVTVTKLGVMRGRRLYLLETHPVAYNPSSGVVTVWPEIQVSIRFEGEYDTTDLPSASPALAGVVLNPEPRARSRGANYLILTAQDFAGSAPLTQFVAAKTAQGFNVTTYTVAEGVDRTAVKAYVESLWGTPDALDYMMIIGDAIGTQHYAEPTARTYTVPPWVGEGANRFVTDFPYICMDGPDDWYPDIGHGRIAVRTVAELQNALDKIMYVNAGDFADPTYATRAAFLAHPDPLAHAEEMQDYMIDTYMTPAGIDCYKLYYTTYGARTTDVINAFNDGCFLVSYYGHSNGFQSWSAPKMDQADIESLGNENLYPFVISFSCSGGQYQYDDYDPGVCEKFMRVGNKGAAGAYGMTGWLVYDWSSWENLHKSLFDAIYVDGIRELGMACEGAIPRMIAIYGADDPICRDYAESWVYFGDPSMELPSPPAENYLIVSASDFIGSVALNQFITHKQALGFNVSTYEATAGTSNTAIKSYIAGLWGTADAPDYVLLVGDTDGSAATSNCVPHFTGGGDKNADTDWPYVCFDAGDDWYPEIPIGRFSVRTTSSLQDVVDKTIFVEQGNFSDPDYVKRGAFLANPDTYSTAETTHDWVIDTYFTPNDYTGIKLYAAQGADTSDVANAINNGALFTLYMGHSGATSGWWDPSFGPSDVNNLSNAGLYGLVFGWSCNTAHYTYDECVGETWLRAPNKGAAAYLSASNYIYWGSAAAWEPSGAAEKAFFTSIFEDGNWEVGPAWVAGLYRFLADYGGWDGDPNHDPTQHYQECRNFLEEFVLLGDPALRLPRPDGFTLSPTPDSQSVCSPPTDKTTYTITVEQLGEFDEPVALKATGIPSGALVDFSDSDLVPPFTSTMTVSKLSSVAPGNYQIGVTGTSASKIETTSVGLSISSSAPDTPTLTGPADGATDVSRTPALSWKPAAGAAEYYLQVAEDVGFGAIVYSATVADTGHTVQTQLDSDTDYFWRVRSENGCGDSSFSDTFSFTTLAQVDYYTEQFAGGVDSFDLAGFSLTLTPDGSGSYYDACIETASGFPTDPSGGANLTISDDGSSSVNPTADVSLYGTSYDSFYVNANGNITFNSADSTYTEELSAHFSQPRISALFDDLNPEQGGAISWKETAELVAVTWENVPEYSAGNSNSFQIEMFLTGEIRITWLTIDSNDSIVGISQGGGTPGDYVELDLDALPDCGAPPTGACCQGDSCSVLSEADCLAAGGTYYGDGTDCDPNPCLNYDPSCLIISEIVQGTESGDCPRWMEITNTGDADFAFLEGGVIVQTDNDTDVVVDLDLAGVVIPAGYSYVIVSNFGGTCTGAFDAIYPVGGDLYTNVSFGYGNERLILTDTADGSNLIDIYGEFGVNGAGQDWEFTDGYSYRRSPWATAAGQTFAPEQWSFGGVGSLGGGDPTQLLLTLTTPGQHEYDNACCDLPGDLDADGVIDLNDLGILLANYGVTSGATYSDGDIDFDGDVDLADLGLLLADYGLSCP